MKAIRTRYSGPTNTRGSRIHATDGDGNRVSVSYQYQQNANGCHEYAAYSLMKKMNWPNELIGGGFGQDQYWVMLPREPHVPPFYQIYFKTSHIEGCGVKSFNSCPLDCMCWCHRGSKQP